MLDIVLNDGTFDIDFTTGSSILSSSCTTHYFLQKLDDGVFADYSETIVSVDSEHTKIQITTTDDDYFLDQGTSRMRVSVASVADLSTAENPQYIYFTLRFVHPCHFAVLNDNGGLQSPLDSAVVNGISDETTINPFSFSFPSLTGSVFECGTQTVSVVEPDPAYSSGPVSSFI